MIYYFSCMLLFNLIYECRICYNFTDYFYCDNYDQDNVYRLMINIITLTMVTLSLLVSIISTFIISFKNDAPKKKQTKGRMLKKVNDITGNNYLGKFSLLVLTGLSIPVNEDWLSLTIYLTVFITIGIIYIKKNLIYINPILIIFNYSIYECICENSISEKNKTVIVMAKNIKADTFKVANNIKQTYIVKGKKNECNDNTEN